MNRTTGIVVMRTVIIVAGMAVPDVMIAADVIVVGVAAFQATADLFSYICALAQ